LEGDGLEYKVLIVEDEKLLREVLTDLFVSKGDTPLTAENGAKALEIAQYEELDAILLDIMMPELNGFEVCRALRKTSDVPIVFLTALSDEDDKLYGYELGADDYITKPFSLPVLYAKTSALIRRHKGGVITGDKFAVGKLTFVISQRRVYAEANEVKLSPKEYDLLLCLARNKNAVMSREQLIVKCWGYDYDGDDRSVDTYIKRLRAALGEYAGCIETVIKAGYRFVE